MAARVGRVGCGGGWMIWLCLAPALLSLALAPGEVCAVNWSNAFGGTFSTGSNWAGGVPPTSVESATFDLSSSAYTVVFTSSVANRAVGVGDDEVEFILNNHTYSLDQNLSLGFSSGDAGVLRV